MRQYFQEHPAPYAGAGSGEIVTPPKNKKQKLAQKIEVPHTSDELLMEVNILSV